MSAPCLFEGALMYDTSNYCFFFHETVDVYDVKKENMLHKKITRGKGKEQMAHLKVVLMKNAIQCKPTLS